MASLESVQSPEGKPLLQPETDHQIRQRGRREEIRAPRLPRPLRESPALRNADGKSRFLRVAEDRERSTFNAEFTLELAGVICNGQTRNNLGRFHGAVCTNGDRLASKLRPLLGMNTEAGFIFTGGGESNFGWSIAGAVRGAPSREDAVAQAVILHENVQMLLASEPSFSFVAKEAGAIQNSVGFDAFWETQVAPRRISLRIPSQTAFGFGSAAHWTGTPERTLNVAVPCVENMAFRSLAEAVVLNPEPILLQVSFARMGLDDRGQAVISDALLWMQRNPAQLQAQLAAASMEPDLSDKVLEYLRKWLERPSGARVRCSIVSSRHPSECFIEMVGGDVFGTRVNAVSRSLAQESESAEVSPTEVREDALDLGSCLPAGGRWPSLFPSFESIANARVRRLFNNEVPSFGNEGVVLGRVAEGSQANVRLPDACRSQHFYILGATGTGKSTLLFNMILQDIRSGRGVGLIDPHGDLYDQLLEAIPLSRANDVVLFNPGHSDSSPGINPLECNGGNRSLQINFIINEMLKTFERLYDMRQCGGPAFEMYFRNAMLLLMESGLEEVALTEFPLVFEDSDYRKFLKNRCKNPLVVSFWNNQAERVKGDWALENMAPYIASKINAFTCNALIRPIIGQAKSTIDFRRVLDNRQIMLIKLSKGVLGQLDTELLGSFILSKIFVTAMGGSAVKADRRCSFSLYVDEFQNFTNDSVGHMLSEARKYGLCLTLANQNLSQLNANPGRQNIVDAVLGNVANLVTFRVGPADAEKLWPYTEPEFGSIDIQGLPNFHAVGRLLTTKGPTRPFVFRTLPPKDDGGYTRAKPEVWQLRENHYTRPVAEVEAQILERRTAHKGKQNPNTRGKATVAEVLGCPATK